MAQTIAEKILSRVVGHQVRSGDEIAAKPDFVLVYPLPGFSERHMEGLRSDFGMERLSEPERFAMFIDHNIPSTSARMEAMNVAARKWCEEQGVAIFERRGIGHLVAAEQGYAVPGAFVVHFDGHVSQLGAFGTLAIGLHFNVLEAFVSPTVTIRVPETSRVEFTGKLNPGSTARDVLHHMVGLIGSGGARSHVLEFGGPGLKEMSVGDIQGMAAMAMFVGAVTAIADPSSDALAHSLPRARLALDPLYSDPGACYAATYNIDLCQIEPTIVLPPHPANTGLLSEHIGTPIDVGYIGSCASGRIEDLRAAASILKGRSVKPGFVLNVIPSSTDIMAQASREGLLETLIEAGAYTSSPTCSFCYGAVGQLLPGQRAMSTGTLNVPGRMGSPDAEIYMGSALSVAAAAIEGRVADPRKYI